MIADSLEVVGDLEGRGKHPEIARHRLLKSEEVDALLLDLDLHAVDHPVAQDDPTRLFTVALEQSFDRQSQSRLRLPGHGEEAHLHMAQLVVEVTMNVDAHPNLPVI